MLFNGIYGPGTSTPFAKCMQSCRLSLPLHITWSLHPSSVDALVDVHGRSHNFPLIHPRGVWLDWHWLLTRPLSTHGVILLSLPLGVASTGVGLVHWSCAWQTPTHKGTISDVMRSWFWGRMHDCPCWSITSLEGTSVTIRSTTLHVSSSHLSLIFLFPLKASAFTKTGSPGFRSMVPTFSHSTISVVGLLPLTGPELPGGQPSISHGHLTHICPHAWQKHLSWGPPCS